MVLKLLTAFDQQSLFSSVVVTVLTNHTLLFTKIRSPVIKQKILAFIELIFLSLKAVAKL